ncbi:MAG: DUF4834 family protein [Fulvivirga sp.]|uniref:DUF4834 family protein n=1 Tax=Fulvivirga sp. TaxID=1931237 RepID=UPI0032ED52ED
MLKFLLIIFILGYVFFKGLGFFIRMILGGSSMNQYGNQQQNSSQRPKNSNVNVDYIPKDQKPKKENFKGGEYVDFEEVK